MANFEATVAESLKAASGPSAKKSKVDVARLPERAVGLAGDGKRDGENRLVRHENKGEVWSWSAAAREWQLIGHSADGDDDATADGGDDDKIVDGQRYDFVFNVDIEAEHPLRLGFNVGQDPWMVRATRGRRRARMPSTFHTHTHICTCAHAHTHTVLQVAQQFIWRHQLDQSVLQTIANFIIKNAGGAAAVVPSTGNVDPLTRGSELPAVLPVVSDCAARARVAVTPRRSERQFCFAVARRSKLSTRRLSSTCEVGFFRCAARRSSSVAR